MSRSGRNQRRGEPEPKTFWGAASIFPSSSPGPYPPRARFALGLLCLKLNKMLG